MDIIIACEESQKVCMAFRNAGHNAFSCDTKVCTGGYPQFHIRGSIFGLTQQGYPVLGKNEYNEFRGWKRMIGHPPCTYLTVTANAWLKDQPKRKSGKLVGEARRNAVKEAEEFFIKLWNSDIDEICLENPVGCMNSKIPPTQIVQPFYFGDSDKKRTCLWLKGLKPLQHFKEDDLFSTKTHVEVKPNYIGKDGKGIYFTDSISGYSINAAAFRSKTFPGIANAMVTQWI